MMPQTNRGGVSVKKIFASLLFFVLFSLTIPIAALADTDDNRCQLMLHDAIDVNSEAPAEQTTFTGTRAELISGTFETDDSTFFVALTDDGAIVLYCNATGNRFGGLPGGIVKQDDGALFFKTDECLPNAVWRQRQKERKQS